MRKWKYLKDIIVCGDIHGFFSAFNHLINKKHPSLILQCGDFGWWPRFHNESNENMYGRKRSWDQFKIKNPKTDILWCPGNHEDWEELGLRKGACSPVMPRVYYMPPGSIFKLDDGRIVLFIGGASSIDKNSRTPGVDWFPQELIPMSLPYKLQEQGLDHVDIVISHTCPNEFSVEVAQKQPYRGWEKKFYDPSQDVLSEILHEYCPSLWYFGHFHVNAKGFYDKTHTRWFALSDIPNSGWWRYLLHKDLYYTH